MDSPLLRPSVVVSVIMALLGPAAVSSHATTWHVPGDAATIQQGIYAASAGDTVLIACGIYLEHDIDLRTGVVIRGATDETDCVVVDAQNLDRVFGGYGVDGTRLERLTIINGSGSGLLIRNCDDITVVGCAFRDNFNAIQGGGIYAENSRIDVHDCVFAGNASTHRGGGLAANSSTIAVTASTFAANGSGYGGGLGLLDSDGEIAWCTFADNTAATHGGGLVATRSGGEFANCHFTGNQAQAGGGLAICDSSPQLRYCTVAANTSASFGGGIYIHDWGAGYSRPELVACSLRGNASNAGGGVWVLYDNTLEAFNTDIRDNTADYGPDGMVYGEAYLTCCDVDLARWGGGGTIQLDNSDCGVGTEPRSWSEVKELFR